MERLWVKREEINLFLVIPTIHLSLATEPLSQEVRQYPPHPAPRSSLYRRISAHIPFREFINGEEGGLGAPKKHSFSPYIMLHAVSSAPTLTAAAPVILGFAFTGNYSNYAQ